MYIFQDKDTLLHKVHPLTLILYIFSVCVFALIFSHPVYLIMLFLSLASVVWAADIIKEWLIYFKMSIMFIVVMILVNGVVVQAGSTVLLWGPKIPGLGKIRITYEAIFFSFTMGIRLMIVISAFCILTYVLNPDRGLQLLGSVGKNTALVLTLSIRLFPLILSDFKRIYDVQLCRGTRYDGNLRSKIKNFLPVINAVILSSLERSFQLAETLQARGYGTGKRSKLKKDIYRPRDVLLITTTIIAIIFGIVIYFCGGATYIFYPLLQKIDNRDYIISLLFGSLFVAPALLNWGWKKFHFLKSKI